MKKEFHIFKQNTDATATNKGFYFQYLITLKTWIEYCQDPNFEIYCETEDDIFINNPSLAIRNYTQVKCYSTNFSLNSPELLSSIINFFKLYLRYKEDYSGTYSFCCSSTIKPVAGQILKKWNDQQKNGIFEVSEFITPLKESTRDFVQNKHSEFIKSTSDPAVIALADLEKIRFLNLLEGDDFNNFVSLIRWDFKESLDDHFESILSEIVNALEVLPFNRNIDTQIFLSYLLHKIIEKSSRSNITDRVLTKEIFEQLTDDTKNKNLLLDALQNILLVRFFELINIKDDLLELKNASAKILRIIENNSSSVQSKLTSFHQDLKDWFQAIDYKTGNLEVLESELFYFDIKIEERRKTISVLIYGITKPIGVADIIKVTKLKASYDCDEAWLVSTSYPSPAAQEFVKGEKTKDVFCYNFDELLEETIDFTNYFDWIEKEVSDKKIDVNFIPLGAKKGEFDPSTKEVVASSTYGKKEGWLEGYINTWLDDDQKEHVSILGEFGTGKTWFTLYYTWRQIQKYKSAKQAKVPRPRLPILIFLRDFAKAMQVELLISDFFFRKHKIEMKGVFNAFNQLNKMGKILLIFDGFDEMADRVDKQKMIDNFWELASVVQGQSKVILTCRNEHFSTIKEGRNVLNAEFKNTTRTIIEDFAKFEVVELLKFDHEQIKKLLFQFTNSQTIELIFKNSNVVDLLSRPIMIELIMDAIKEIEEDQSVDMTKIYFYATRRKMERDILQNRTFTSLSDKVFFMCELAWEMISNDKLTVNYKEFPQNIFSYFNIEEKDLDYWRYDMRSQSLLIVDDEDGNYKPAHKSLIEFFVAYKLVGELGMLKESYRLSIDGAAIFLNQEKHINDLSITLGKFSLGSNKFHVVDRFVSDLINNDKLRLWRLFDLSQQHYPENKILSGNLIKLLSYMEKDFSYKKLNRLELEDVTFSNADLTYADFTETLFKKSSIINCDLTNASLDQVKMMYDQGTPILHDISGNNTFDFITDEKIIMVGRFGFHILSLTDPSAQQFLHFDAPDFYFNDLVVVADKQMIIGSTNSEWIIFSYKDLQLKILKRIKMRSWGMSSLVAKGEKLAAFLDMNSDDIGNLQIWSINDQVKKSEWKFDARGLFNGCFFNQSNRIVCGGRGSTIYFFDMDLGILTEKIKLKDIVKNHPLSSSDIRSGFIYSLDLTPNDNFLAIATTINAVIIWDLKAKQIAHTLEIKDGNYSTNLKFSNNGKYLAVHIEWAGVKLYDTATWNVIYSKKVHCSNIKFSSDDKHLIFGGDIHEGEIFVLNISKFEIALQFHARMDFSGLSIKNLSAPLWHIKFYIDRGATGWFTEQELLNMDDEGFELLFSFLHRRGDDDKRPKAEKVTEIINYLYKG